MHSSPKLLRSGPSRRRHGFLRSVLATGGSLNLCLLTGCHLCFTWDLTFRKLMLDTFRPSSDSLIFGSSAVMSNDSNSTHGLTLCFARLHLCTYIPHLRKRWQTS